MSGGSVTEIPSMMSHGFHPLGVIDGTTIGRECAANMHN